MTKAKTCAHEGCRAPSNFIKDNGFCHAHGPGAKERLQLMGMRGGETMRRRWAGGALLPNELPPLVDHESAKQWRRCVRSCTSTAPSPPMRGVGGKRGGGRLVRLSPSLLLFWVVRFAHFTGVVASKFSSKCGGKFNQRIRVQLLSPGATSAVVNKFAVSVLSPRSENHPRSVSLQNLHLHLHPPTTRRTCELLILVPQPLFESMISHFNLGLMSALSALNRIIAH